MTLEHVQEIIVAPEERTWGQWKPCRLNLGWEGVISRGRAQKKQGTSLEVGAGSVGIWKRKIRIGNRENMGELEGAEENVGRAGNPAGRPQGGRT